MFSLMTHLKCFDGFKQDWYGVIDSTLILDLLQSSTIFSHMLTDIIKEKAERRML